MGEYHNQKPKPCGMPDGTEVGIVLIEAGYYSVQLDGEMIGEMRKVGDYFRVWSGGRRIPATKRLDTKKLAAAAIYGSFQERAGLP